MTVNKEQLDIINEILIELDNDNKTWSETVQVGDYVDSRTDGHYTFSGHQYKTKGKLYQVQQLDMRNDPLVIVYGDYVGDDPDNPEIIWLGPSNVIIRNGVVIWQSSIQKALAAIDLTTLSIEELKNYNSMIYNPFLPNG